MRTLLLTTAAILALSSPTWASESNHCVGGGCNSNNTYAEPVQRNVQKQRQTMISRPTTNPRQDTSVSVEGDDFDPPAYAPGLAGLTGTNCMGSVTGSGGGLGLFSFGFGKTYTDDNCVRLQQARALNMLGLNTAAIQHLCRDPELAKSIVTEGITCHNVVFPLHVRNDNRKRDYEPRK